MKFIKYNFPFLILLTFLLILVIFFSTSEDILAEDEAQFYNTEIFVGLAELYYGSNSIEGNLELVEENDTFAEEVDMGRISFYLKGKIKGKYLLTAWFDTEEQKIDELFKNLDERKKDSPFEKIDAEKYYPIYGDDSTVSSQVNTAGKLYIALESETFKALWGNYRVNLDQNQLINFRKSLYGLNISYDNRLKIDSFLHQPFTQQKQDELELTGGILYYLNNDDITAGSEAVTLELRDASTDRVLSEKDLVPGIDYQINYLQGRIILKNKTELINVGDLIENEEGEDKYYLRVNYEVDYDYQDGDYDSYGVESSYQLSDNLVLSGTSIKEKDQNGETYKIEGYNLAYSNQKTDFSLDWAASENIISSRYFSDDGGITYEEVNITNPENAEAWNLELKRKLTDNIVLDTYYIDKEAGFNSSSSYSDEDKRDYGVEALIRGERFNNSLSFSKSETESSTTEITELKSDFDYSERTDLKLELQNKREKADSVQVEDILTAALGLDYMLTENSSIYASQQLTLSNDSSSDDYDITTLGGSYNKDKWSFNAQAEAGDKESISFGTGYRISEQTEIYTNLEQDLSDDHSTTTTVGTNSKLNDKTDLYGEYRIEDSSDQEERSNVVGLDYSPLKGLVMSLDYSQSDVVRAEEDNFEREIIGFGTSYTKDNLKTSNRLEYRKDEDSQNLEQFIFKSDLNWKYSQALSLLSEIEYSIEKEAEEDEYLDGTFGFAYRPVKHDRLNILGKYSYIKEDNEITNESDDSGFANYPAEKAQVFALDFIFDLNSSWQLAEKLAYKNGEIKLNSVNDDWTSSETYLWVNRINYQLRDDIELFTEYRILENKLAEDKKSGFLIGGYKRFANNLKLGAGYNFTDFNDDLTDLSYEADGWFVNIIKAW
jgi:hypothetical protein